MPLYFIAYFNYTAENDESHDTLADEVLHFGTNCPSCNAPCETNMKLTSKIELDQDFLVSK
jgi:aldehyde:ferredoxin oxidoreductase